MVPVIIVVGTSAVVTPSIVATTIIAAAVVSATIVTAVISVAPIRSVPIITPVSVIRCAVKRTGAVVAGPEKNRDRNWQAKDKSNPSASRRFSEERKSRDNQQEDNELLHNWILDELPTDLIKQSDKMLMFQFSQRASCNPGSATGYCKRRNATPRTAMTNRRAKASTMIPLIDRTCAGRVEIVSRFDSDSSAFRIAALLIGS